MQRSRSTASVPNGAPAGNGIVVCGTGACSARWSKANASVRRLSLVAANVAAMRGGSATCHSHSARSHVLCARVDQPEMLALIPLRVGDRLRDRHLEAQRGEVLRRFAAGGEHRDVAGAPCQRRHPQIDADRRDVLDLEREHPRRQAASVPRKRCERTAVRRRRAAATPASRPPARS